MDFMTTLDVLIGLVTVYLVFALTVTALNETVAALWSSRAKWLERGIASLLSDNPKTLAMAKATAVLSSPFVTYLGTKGVFRTWRPSYLPAWTLLQGLLSTTGTLSANAFASVATIEAAAKALPANSPAKAIILDLCARSGTEVTAFRTGLEAWFNTFEDQVTAWYKQKTHIVVTAMSVVLVGAMNIDTMALARQLSSDTKVRAVVVAQGLQTAKTPTIDKLPGAKPEGTPHEQLAKVAHDLADTGLRIGWDEAAIGQLLHADGTFASGWDFLVKLVGLFVSAAAISLGAPFWFNTLKTLASIRSVGPSTDESAAKRAKQGAPT